MTSADRFAASPTEALEMLQDGGRLRQGRSIGRTLYVQRGREATNVDLCVGIVDSPRLAALIVEAVNAHLQS